MSLRSNPKSSAIRTRKQSSKAWKRFWPSCGKWDTCLLCPLLNYLVFEKVGTPMDPMTPEQFLENMRGWKPTTELKTQIAEKLRTSHLSEEMAGKLGEIFHHCSQCTYDYIQYINELAASQLLDRDRFLPLVAQLGRLVKGLQESGGGF